MECKTIIEYNNKGQPVWKDKVKHPTLRDAQYAANLINKRKNIFIKREAYECKKCEKFHVGTTTEMLLNKKVPRVRQWIGRNMKVVGFVNLSNYTKELVKIKTIRNKLKKAVDDKGLITISKNGRLISKQIMIDKNFYQIDVKPKTIKIITKLETKYIKWNKIYPSEKLNQITSFTPGFREIKNYILENYEKS